MNRPQTIEDNIVSCTARIVMGYVAGNKLPPAALVTLITTVSKALRPEPEPEPEIDVVPAVPEVVYVASDYPREQAEPRFLTREEIANSIQETYLVCFEDGLPYRMLARHLRLFGLTPAAYRAKWGLPADYPMMPLADFKHRAKLARQRNLGQYDRSTAKPRKKYKPKSKPKPKPKPYSTDFLRGGWRREEEEKGCSSW